MEKSSYAAGQNNGPRRAPEGAGTSTQSGVTVYEPSTGMNHPPPPSYDQATGAAPAPAAAATTVTHNVSYNTTTSTQWGQAPGPITASTQYVTYTTPASSSTTTYHYAPVQPPPPPPPTHQPHVHQQQPGQASVVIIQQPMLPLGPEPVYITCPACHVQKLTRIEYEPSSRTHLMAALLCLFGLWCCVCLPYCAGSCMNAQHYCGNCGKFLGTYGNAL